MLANLIVAAISLASPQDSIPQQQPSELEKIRKEWEEFKRRYGPLQDDLRERGAREAGRNPGSLYSRLGRFGENDYLGGYIDLEYIAPKSSNADTFDQHRFVPMIYADVSDRVKIATELEIEHGNGTDTSVEFATIDYWFSDEINFRAGILLLPLGHFNLVHDAPLQDLTRRPLVDEFLVPVVLRDPGMGLYGTFDLDPWQITYELYVTNGFKGLTNAGATPINRSDGLRKARPSEDVGGGKKFRDFNDNKALTARAGVSPFLGLEIGLSAHQGKYDEAGDNELEIVAWDGTIEMGSVYDLLFSGEGFVKEAFFATEIVFEVARADIERNAFALASGVPGDFEGWFTEVRVHFILFDSVFKVTDESTFTLTYRREGLDLDGDRRSRRVFGLNYRPREHTVFKLEYESNEEGGTRPDSRNDAVLFSVASYF